MIKVNVAKLLKILGVKFDADGYYYIIESGDVKNKITYSCFPRTYYSEDNGVYIEIDSVESLQKAMEDIVYYVKAKKEELKEIEKEYNKYLNNLTKGE